MLNESRARRAITAALFVDFQNVYVNLARVNPRAPREFARKPNLWLNWFEKGSHQGVGGQDEPTLQRRILVRRVYVDDSFRQYYENFTHGAGFTIIDCPKLTREGKNAADIRMVVDILDMLAHPTGFDEFIILSSDADFTPVLHRLRAYDRLSTIVSLKNVSAALKSSCDFAVSEDVFVQQALRMTTPDRDAEPVAARRARPSPAGLKKGNQGTVALDPVALGRAVPEPDLIDGQQTAPIRSILNYVKSRLQQSEKPIHSSALAKEILENIDPTIKTKENWYSAGSFPKMLRRYPTEGINIAVERGAIYVFDPARHDQPVDARDDDSAEERPLQSILADPTTPPVLAILCGRIGLPALGSDVYAKAFEIWGECNSSGTTVLSEKQRRVRDGCTLDGKSISRRQIGTITFFLRHGGTGEDALQHPQELAAACYRNALRYAEERQIEFDRDAAEALAVLLGCEPAPPIASLAPTELAPQDASPSSDATSPVPAESGSE